MRFIKEQHTDMTFPWRTNYIKFLKESKLPKSTNKKKNHKYNPQNKVATATQRRQLLEPDPSLEQQVAEKWGSPVFTSFCNDTYSGFKTTVHIKFNNKYTDHQTDTTHQQKQLFTSHKIADNRKKQQGNKSTIAGCMYMKLPSFFFQNEWTNFFKSIQTTNWKSVVISEAKAELSAAVF